MTVRYIDANVSMSQGWRTSGPATAPHGLQHRPSHITRHMQCMLTRAAEMPPTSIHTVDDNTYTVASSSSSQTYTVFFGCEIPSCMPSCDCYMWQRLHLPCKHVCCAAPVWSDLGQVSHCISRASSAHCRHFLSWSGGHHCR